jgi:hypothetical protein
VSVDCWQVCVAFCVSRRWLVVSVFTESIVATRPPRVGFVVDEVELGQVFLPVLRFSPVIVIPTRSHIHPSIADALLYKLSNRQRC